MSRTRTLGLWPRLLLAPARRRALATGWRLRTSVAVAVALTLFFGWVGTSAASAADDFVSPFDEDGEYEIPAFLRRRSGPEKDKDPKEPTFLRRARD